MNGADAWFDGFYSGYGQSRWLIVIEYTGQLMGSMMIDGD